MPIDTMLETYVQRSIGEAVKAAVPGVYVVEVGMRRGVPETTQQWVTVDPLAFLPHSTRRDLYDGQELFQVACFGKFAELNDGAVVDGPFQLAGRVRAALEKQDVLVKTYGQATESFVGTLKLHACDRRYQGEAAMGMDYPANVHAVILTFQGTLNVAA